MNPNWVKISSYTQPIQAEIVKQMLVENDIPAVILNRRDSSYLIGVVEVYVDKDHVVEAIALIDSFGEEYQSNED